MQKSNFNKLRVSKFDMILENSNNSAKLLHDRGVDIFKLSALLRSISCKLNPCLKGLSAKF